MVWQGFAFVIIVPYANQRFADVRRMLFDRCDRCGFFPVSITNSAVFPRNWGSFRPVPRRQKLQLRVVVFGDLFMHMPLLSKMVFLHHVLQLSLKSRHILCLII